MEKKFDFKTFFGKYAIYFVLLIEIILFSILSPHFLSIRNLTNVLRQVSIVGIMAVGMTFVILTGGIDLSVGGVKSRLEKAHILVYKYMHQRTGA